MPLPLLYGLIGYPVKHSFSAAMHTAAFKKLNLNAEYRLFEITPEKLEDFLLREIKIKDILGEEFISSDITCFNVTIPHKIRTKQILEINFPNRNEGQVLQDSYYVKLSGAVNTVKKSDVEK